MTARLNKEFKLLNDKPQDWRSVQLVGGNILAWRCTVIGPDDSPYAKGKFAFDFDIPSEYPFKPPKVKAVTRIYHPNVSNKDGSICLPVITPENWRPQMKMEDVMMAIRQLLSEPGADHPLEAEIGEQMQKDPAAFRRTAAEWTAKYAI